MFLLIRRIVVAAFSVYAALAVYFGFALAEVIPAVNWKGAAYYGLIWPAWPISYCLDMPAPPIPEWAFTFEEKN